MAKKKLEVPFLAEEYSYRAHYIPEEAAFIGLVDEFPGLSAFGDSLENAVKEIQVVVAEGLQLLAEKNEPFPEPLSRREYSGKFVVRLNPSLHRRLATEAARRGVSLNEHVVEKLVGK